MGRTKNRNQKERTIRPSEILQIILFIGVCFYMATCGSANKQAQTSTVNISENESTANLRKNIITYAKKYIGKKYRYAGRSPKGFDCSGFTYFVMSNFDINLSPVSRIQENEGKVISTKNAKKGDLLFFRRSKKGMVFHVGIVVSNGKDGIKMIHSSSSRGVVIDNISQNSYWKAKIMTARDIING